MANDSNDQLYNVDLNTYIRKDKADLALKSLVPIGFTGQLIMWPTITAPAGFLICDGSLVLKADYPDLWVLLADTWGVSTTTSFYIPDMRQRVPVGKHSSGTFAALNNSGGAETVTLATAEIPSHTHAINAYASNNESAGFGLSASASFTNRPMVNVSGGQNSNPTGGGGAHANLQPYRVVNFIIKT
jgi:microcystin-dependent protein